jgi:hypothetical protein
MTILDLTKNLDWFGNFEDEPLMSYQNRHFLLGHQRLSSFKLKNHKKFLVIPRIDHIYSKYLNLPRDLVNIKFPSVILLLKNNLWSPWYRNQL